MLQNYKLLYSLLHCPSFHGRLAYCKGHCMRVRKEPVACDSLRSAAPEQQADAGGKKLAVSAAEALVARRVNKGI